jgi:hypothetical protein
MRGFLPLVCLLVPSVGLACSCLRPTGKLELYVLDSLCAADAVFVGDVESSMPVRDVGLEYKIWPRETFKGQLESPTYALAHARETCGYQFSVGGSYLIFADRYSETNYLSSSSCGLTQLFDKNAFVYEVLAKSKNDLERLCGEEAVRERRLERLREKALALERLEKETQLLLETAE